MVLVAAALAVPQLWDWNVEVNWPPLNALWEPRLSVMMLPAIVIGLSLVLLLPRLAERLPWRTLLLTAFAGMWVWTMALAMTDGTKGITRVFERNGEYVYDAQRVDSIPTMVSTFIDRMPRDSGPLHWKTHVAGHPPGALLDFVLIDRLGITDLFWIGVVVVTIGCTAIIAALVTLRALGSTELARSAMPWIALAPSAVWMAVNADTLFTAISAWGIALLAIASTTPGTRRRAMAGVGAGLLLGLCVYQSYGLVLLGILAVAVLIIARSCRPLPWALLGSAVVVAIFTAMGFAWWEAYPVLVERYNFGIASDRPYAYFVWANLAAWTFTAGLAVWAAIPRALHAVRERNPAALLALAAMLTIGVATLSGMSKGETERIFMPFTIWVVALPMLLPGRWHKPLLFSQVVLALCVEALLLTRW